MHDLTYPKWLEGDLRTDHAGETGAVWIYKGILSVSKDRRVRAFAQSHLQTELKHLHDIEGILEPRLRSRLLPLWRFAGFITGALPSLFGANAVFRTIEAVETFVDTHYSEQILRLSPVEDLDKNLAIVRAILLDCRADEIAHRDEARFSARGSASKIIRFWCTLVSQGSQIAVACARQV